MSEEKLKEYLIEYDILKKQKDRIEKEIKDHESEMKVLMLKNNCTKLSFSDVSTSFFEVEKKSYQPKNIDMIVESVEDHKSFSRFLLDKISFSKSNIESFGNAGFDVGNLFDEKVSRYYSSRTSSKSNGNKLEESLKKEKDKVHRDSEFLDSIKLKTLVI